MTWCWITTNNRPVFFWIVYFIKRQISYAYKYRWNTPNRNNRNINIAHLHVCMAITKTWCWSQTKVISEQYRTNLLTWCRTITKNHPVLFWIEYITKIKISNVYIYWCDGPNRISPNINIAHLHVFMSITKTRCFPVLFSKYAI